MAESELKLGNKYECFNCGAKFYDLAKPEPMCPKCGANQKDAEKSESPLVTQATRRRRKAEVARSGSDEETEDAPSTEIDDEEIADLEEDEDFEEEEETEDAD